MPKLDSDSFHLSLIMRRMMRLKLKQALFTSLATLFMVGGRADLVSNAGSSNDHSQAEIFKKTKEAYAALTSYIDQGTTVASLNGITITTTFTIKLARPNLYRVGWVQTNDSAYSTTTTKPQSVWSAGDGDFLDILGQGPKKQANQEIALASATGISGGAAATVPSAFFKTQWGNPLGILERSGKQQADEKVGDVGCYVFAGSLKGSISTIWIGKQDFLIHQFRRVTSAAAMKAAMDEAAKVNPEMAARMSHIEPTDSTSTETHTNIVVNQILTASDFAH